MPDQHFFYISRKANEWWNNLYILDGLFRVQGSKFLEGILRFQKLRCHCKARELITKP